MKTNKKMWIIGGIVVLALIVGIIWWYSSKKETEVTAVDSNASNANQAIVSKIAAKITAIKGDSNWGGQIKANAVAQGYTIEQAFASNAIWALKHDGEIPLDTYGAGEWGHIDYVKKNY